MRVPCILMRESNLFHNNLLTLQCVIVSCFRSLHAPKVSELFLVSVPFF
jgi:hypothetical protein